MAPITALLALAACGRVGFESGSTPDAHATADAAPARGDAAQSDAEQGVLPDHQYSFTGSLADDMGGPALEVVGGGTFVPGGYQYAANQGLRIVDVMPSFDYTLELAFTPASVTGYAKLVDFKRRGSDSGLYIADGKLQFVVHPVADCPNTGDCWTSPLVVFSAGMPVVVRITRDESGIVTARVNGASQWVFLDDSGVATFDDADSTANVFVDDTVTSGEAGPGIVRQIRIYDSALP